MSNKKMCDCNQGRLPCTCKTSVDYSSMTPAERLEFCRGAEQHQGEPVACAHEWTDDGEFMLVCTACGAQENHDPKWRDMANAPRDGTLVRLLVEFTEHATEDSDAMPCPTIGANSFDQTGEDVWQFAGWSWEQDCFTHGEGEPVGWLPLLDTPHADPAEAERLRADLKHLMNTSVKEEVFDIVCKERDNLRGQLAEAHALLQRAATDIREAANAYHADHDEHARLHVLASEMQALSASAEPSAPKHETCKACHGEGVIHTGIEESPTTLCKRCDGSGNEPSAPVERDERAEFELYRDRRNALLISEGSSAKWRVTQAHYATWEARATLERKP